MHSDTQIAVTGMGCVSPLGNDVASNWEKLITGQSGINFISKFELDNFPVKIAGEVKNLELPERLNTKSNRKLDDFIKYALAAAHQAIEQADIEELENVAVIAGSGQGGIGNIETEMAKVEGSKYRRISPYLIPTSVIGMASGLITESYGFQGASYGVSSTCSTSSHAIVDACRLIKLGEADVVIAGGAEASITPFSLMGFSRLRALSQNQDDPTRASRPFDKNRDGFVSSEGAGMLVLESKRHAIKRGAKILAEISGWGLSSDAHHMTAPHPEARGQCQAMSKAISMAKTNLCEIDYLNAHGTSTPLNDASESKAVAKVFNGHARKLSMSSTKSMTGHMLGATGAVELIYCVKAMEEGAIPPTINLDTPDPECQLDYTSNQYREKSVKTCLSNSFGFGGTNCSILLKSA